MKDIKPITLESKKNGKVYTLEFNRASVKRAERLGFDIQEVTRKSMSGITDLFYYSFFMHHGNTVSKDDAERILFDEMHGMPDGVLDRLAELYAVCLESLYQDEENAKNSEWSVIL
jgi:hypothetical protein